MALKIMILLCLFVLQCFLILTCHCQTNFPQNIETFYPIETPTQPLEPPPKAEASPSPSPSPVVASTSSSSNNKIVTAVAATATGTLVVSVIIFLSIKKCFRARKKNVAASALNRSVVPQVTVFERMEGNIKGLIVDEDGLDVVYWKKLQEKNYSPKNKEDDDDEGNQEIPMLRGKSSTSHMNIFPKESYTIMKITPPAPPPIVPSSVGNDIKGVQKSDSPTQPFSLALLPSSPKKLSNYFSSIPKMTSPPTPSIAAGKSQPSAPGFSTPPPPPPPIPDRKSTTPPPPPPPPPMRSAPPPPPPPVSTRKSSAPPPPPPKAGGFHMKSSSKPPPTPIETSASSSTNKQGNSSEVKLKPLHWDKVNTNLDHSMVWDKIDRGSFR